jgi:hypothetical protein
MVKKWVIALSIASFFLWGCSNAPEQAQNGVGMVAVSVSNGDVQTLAKTLAGSDLTGATNIWLTIKEVQVHTTGNSWQTVAQPNARFDFLTLVNGLTKPLELFPLPAGKYTQIRLILAEQDTTSGEVPAFANEVVINGTSYPVVVPSGTQTGIKCHHPFTIKADEQTEICLQFDISKALHLKGDSSAYIMHPTYKMIDCSDSSVPPASNSDQLPTPDPDPVADPIAY